MYQSYGQITDLLNIHRKAHSKSNYLLRAIPTQFVSQPGGEFVEKASVLLCLKHWITKALVLHVFDTRGSNNNGFTELLHT